MHEYSRRPARGAERYLCMAEPTKHRRRSIRLKDFDYARAGAYFVTICVRNKECLLGEIIRGDMAMTTLGTIVQSIWDDLPHHYLNIDVDAFIIMPNHVHGIIILGEDITRSVGAGPRACPSDHRQQGQPRGAAPTQMSLPDVVHRFKSLTTNRYRKAVAELVARSSPGRLWQRNYYEHVIRNENELNRIRQYVIDNPLKWELDRENPAAKAVEPKEPWEV